MTRGNQRDLARAKNQKKQQEQQKKKNANEKTGLSLTERKHSLKVAAVGKHWAHEATNLVLRSGNAFVTDLKQDSCLDIYITRRKCFKAKCDGGTALNELGPPFIISLVHKHGTIKRDAELMREKQRKKEEQSTSTDQKVDE